MSTLQKLAELEARRLQIQDGYDQDAKKKASTAGKLTARERIENLFDENSFVEIGAFVKSRSTGFNLDTQTTPADGVVCGYGTVSGNLVYVYSQDASVLGGALGEMHAAKIVKTYEDALKMGAPIVGFIDTVGLRLQEGVDALAGYGNIYQKAVEASGLIPQLTVICGDCGGGASFIAGLSDFTFIATKNGKLFLNSPNTLEDKAASFDNVAAAKVHLEESGLATLGTGDESSLIEEVAKLLTYLPQNASEDVPCYACTDDLNRVDSALNEFCFETGNNIDVVKSIVDNGEFMELSPSYGTKSFVAFARMNGATVGIIANKEVVADYASVKKMTKFVTTCDSFNIPIVTLTDIERFESTLATEKLGMIKETALLVKAFSNATVPKVNVILHHAYGSAYITMNSKHIGADYVFAWPTAEVSTMAAESAVRIMFEQEIKSAEVTNEYIAEQVACYEENNTSAYAVAARGYIDDIIEPAATRKRIIAALEVLFTKQVF